MLVSARLGYFGSVSSSRRNHCLTVLRLSPVRRLISRMDTPSLGCILLILAYIPTLITPDPLLCLEQDSVDTWVSFEQSRSF